MNQIMNEIMRRRASMVGGEWTEAPGGYSVLLGTNFFGQTVAYVALPEDHPDVGEDYDSLHPNVNGGLTYGSGNVFGWDYGHWQNGDDVPGDLQRALRYFRLRSSALGRAYLSARDYTQVLRWKLHAFKWRTRAALERFRSKEKAS